MAYSTVVTRHKTREVGVGDTVVGGENPIWVQSMTTTNTFDVEETVAQIHRLEEAGCEIVRVTVPKKEDVEACKVIRSRIKIPLIADIHYDYRMALACLDATTDDGRPAVDKIRINPGNIGGDERFKEVVRKARDKGIPMRIGVNSGSLEKDLIEKYGFPCPEALVESALRYIEMAEALGYREIIVSLKASHVPTAVECYTLFAVEERLSDPRRDHRGGLEGIRHAQERRGDRRDRPAGDRRHDPGLAPGRPGPRDRRRVRHPPRLRPPGDPARGRRLPDLRPARHRPGADRRRGRGEDGPPQEPAPDQHPRLPGQRLRRGQGGRPRHRRRARARGSSSRRACRSATSRKPRWSQALLEEVERFDEDTPALKSHQEKEKKKSALTVLN